jgi:hypothetical protein
VCYRRKKSEKEKNNMYLLLIHVFTPGFSIELVQHESLLGFALAGD